MSYKKIILLSLFSFFGCSKTPKKQTFIYNSMEFKVKTESFSVSIDEAALLVKEYLRKKKIRKNAQNKVRLHLIYDNYYVFTTNNSVYNAKSGEYNLMGIWVDGETSELVEQDTNFYLQIILKLPFTVENQFEF